MTTATIRTITLDEATGVCTLKSSDGVVKRCSAAALGMALLGSAGRDDSATAGIEWTDYLPTHGVAVGRRGLDKIQVGLLQQRARQVVYSGGAPYTITFPLMLTMLISRGGVLQRSQLFLVDPTKREQLFIGSTTPCLTHFPYGNVYSPTGLICWEQVSTTGIATLRQLDDLFFGSGFNGDLVGIPWNDGERVKTLTYAGSYTVTPEAAVRGLMNRGE